jgi:hypothetical protein
VNAPQDRAHVGRERIRIGMIAVHPDVIRSELEEDEIGPLAPQPRAVLLQESAVFAGCVSAPAEIEDSGPDPFPVEELLEKMRICFGRDAVARAEDDDSAGRRGAERDKKRHQENEGMPAPPQLHGGIISPPAGPGKSRTGGPIPCPGQSPGDRALRPLD